jgi:GH24 family phage-related lysozyme (muramidase)
LPRFARLTRDTFAGVEKLPHDAQGALLSLVFNRGTSLTGARRTEMRAIRDELATGRASLPNIADALEAMQRLWPDARGLRDRRAREAALVRGAKRRYLAAERIDV